MSRFVAAVAALLGSFIVFSNSGCGSKCNPSGLEALFNLDKCASSSSSSGAFKEYIYATSTSGGGRISALSIDTATGTLTPVAGSPFNSGTGTQGMAVDPLGRFVYASNTSAGTISVFAIDKSTGALSHVAGSPFAADSINPLGLGVSPNGSVLCSTHYANPGEVSCYTVNPTTGALTSAAGSPFSAEAFPTSVVFDNTGSYVYVAGIFNNMISSFSVNGSGVLASLGPSVATCGMPEELLTYTAGSYLYAICDGTVSLHTINTGTGALSAATPFSTAPVRYSFGGVISTNGSLLYTGNRNNPGGPGDIVGFTRNSGTGALTAAAGSPVGVVVAESYDVAMSYSGLFLYATLSDGTVKGYSVNGATGAITELSDSPYSDGVVTTLFKMRSIRIAQ